MNPNISLLVFLYFLQGLPYGIQAKFLPIALRSSGVSLTVIGFYKFLFLPWTLKVLWAPFVDGSGTKKQWLTGSLTCLACACWLTTLIELTDVVSLACNLLVQNLFASIQDISVDALAIAVLSPSDIGVGNTAQVVGYKIGGLIGGAVFLLLNDAAGHRAVFAVIGAVYIVSSAVVFRWRLPEAPQQGGHPRKQGTAAGAQGETRCDLSVKGGRTLEPLSSVRTALNVEGTGWMLAYVIVYKLGENGALSLVPMFLVDQRLSQAAVGFWTGVVGSALTIVGSCAGGWLLSANRLAASGVSSLLAAVRLVIVALQTSLVCMFNLHWGIVDIRWTAALLGLTCVQLFVSGVTTTVTFGWMMTCSQRAPASTQATHYSILASAEVIGKLVCVSLDGLIADAFGYGATFAGFTVLSALTCWHLQHCPHVLRAVDEVKDEKR